MMTMKMKNILQLIAIFYNWYLSTAVIGGGGPCFSVDVEQPREAARLPQELLRTLPAWPHSPFVSKCAFKRTFLELRGAVVRTHIKGIRQGKVQKACWS